VRFWESIARGLSRTLLETLSSAGNFEVVGNEDVDGFPTRRLRATAPEEALDLGRLRQGVEGTATSLDVWVDDDDLVRRLDFRIEEPWDLQGSSWHRSGECSVKAQSWSALPPSATPPYASMWRAAATDCVRVPGAWRWFGTAASCGYESACPALRLASW
jgi:hypothetical protein